MKIDRQAIPFIFILGLLAIVVAPFTLAGALVCVALLLGCVGFFRDPERDSPDDPAALLSPADGRVLHAGPATVSVFLSLFDVHVCRSPVAGVVETVEHTAGRFLAAYKDDASEHNERVEILICDGERRISFTLVAGLVARRIVCRVRPGDRVEAGQRIGLIRFGSRVDLALPPGVAVPVEQGQRVVAGETVLARFPI